MSDHLEEDLKEHKVKLLLDEPKARAKQRLMDFAESLESDYQELMQRAKDYQDHGSYWYEGDRFEDQGLYDTFWEDYELVTGTTVAPDNKYGFFSCSC